MDLGRAQLDPTHRACGGERSIAAADPVAEATGTTSSSATLSQSLAPYSLRVSPLAGALHMTQARLWHILKALAQRLDQKDLVEFVS